MNCFSGVRGCTALVYVDRFTLSPSCIDRIITKDNGKSHIVMNDKQAINEGENYFGLV